MTAERQCRVDQQGNAGPPDVVLDEAHVLAAQPGREEVLDGQPGRAELVGVNTKQRENTK
ncbi:hypothetical protein F7725_009592 [Dissostichus mawsoni]|uniref:Uncharacterized protein n=1 Tax=Dissostichus mawsoni TaxID=36200 RepID=A0A7J5XL68_DISMA|nr:hypothetical protein F7725_009592 [Dissostichus mawsoni]